MSEDLNVVFVVLDALRAKNLGCYGYGEKTSPTLDRLAEEGLLFERAFSCINATEPSLLSIFSGRYPASHGIHSHGIVGDDDGKKQLTLASRKVVLLPQMLRANGYETLAIDWLGDRYDWHQWHRWGYDYYSGILNPGNFKKRRPGFLRGYKDSASEITDHALALLDRQAGRKFFMFLHYWDTHMPYNPPQEYVREYEGKYRPPDVPLEETYPRITVPILREYVQHSTKGLKSTKDVIARYDGAIRYSDAEVGRLLRGLNDRGLYDNTLIIVTADHGESMTEHGVYFMHGGLYDETIRVPLIIRHPEFRGKRIPALVQHADLVPTILEMLSMGAAPYADGKSLMPLILGKTAAARHAVYGETSHRTDVPKKTCIRTGTHKLICPADGEGRKELYDLANDPQETKNIAEENPDLAAALCLELHSKLDGMKNAAFTAKAGGKEQDPPEQKSIYLLREMKAGFKNPAVLWSCGKDSTTMLWLIRKAFFGRVPFPVIHIDTGCKSGETYAFRDFLAKEWDLELLVAKNEAALKEGTSPKTTSRLECCNRLKTQALKSAIETNNFDAIIVSIRWDEHGIRGKERHFSPRDGEFRWQYENQPPEFFDVYPARFAGASHVRIHPLLHWSEADVWRYIRKEGIPVNPLYFSKNSVRYRSIGCEPCTLPVPSGANTVDAIIAELEKDKRIEAERAGRLQDKEDDGVMQRLRALGYM